MFSYGVKEYVCGVKERRGRGENIVSIKYNSKSPEAKAMADCLTNTWLFGIGCEPSGAMNIVLVVVVSGGVVGIIIH